MKKNFLASFLSIFFLLNLLFLLPSQLFASTPCCSGSPVFGPAVYARDTGKPVVIESNFSVFNSGQYILCIINGDDTGNNRISSAVISINGSEVVSPNEFNQQVEIITKPVALNKDNLISVEVRSSPGSYITVSILGPPKINITSPANGSTLTDSTITVTGTIDDNSSSVTVNGVSAAISNGVFSAAISLVEGQNNIEVAAINQCGFTATQNITVAKTTIPKGPPLTLCVVTAEWGPGACNGATVYQNWDAAWLFGNVSDPRAEVKINGITVDVSINGSFSFDLEPLVYGQNTITATATNASGTSTANLTIIYDNIPPQIKITSPLNNATINTPYIAVTGAVADEYPIRSVRVQNINTSYIYYDANINNGAFIAENIQLREGINSINVIVEDMAYNLNDAEVSVYYISSTTSGSIYGTVSDAITAYKIPNASITITDTTNAQTAISDTKGFFSITNITPGTINGTISKTGYLSHAFTDSINSGEILLLDIALIPGATISGAVTNEATKLPISGAAISITDSQKTQTATTDTNGKYTITGIAQGALTININKTGYLSQQQYLSVEAGKAYAINFTLKEISGGLNIQIASPYSNSTIYNDKITVSGVINANTADIGITVNGKPAAIVGNQFTINNIPLTIGQNTITATITDITGNTATTSITVYGQQAQQPIRITTVPESGITPLTAKLTIESSIINSTGYISYTGPAMMEVNQINNTEFELKITTEGIYYITYTATDSNNNQYSDTLAIAAISRDAIDTLLKGKWGLMKEALSQGDIENALIHFSENSKDKYRQIFTLLQNNISSIATGMQPIQLIYLKDGVAKYRIRRQEAAGEITYYIYFEQDKNGIWRIRQY